MIDLIERLRNRRAFGQFPGDSRWVMLVTEDDDCKEAADEIERLRAALDEALSVLAGSGDSSWGENMADQIRKDHGI